MTIHLSIEAQSADDLLEQIRGLMPLIRSRECGGEVIQASPTMLVLSQEEVESRLANLASSTSGDVAGESVKAPRRGRPRKESSAPQPQPFGVSPSPAAAEPSAESSPAPATAAAPATFLYPVENVSADAMPDHEFRERANTLVSKNFEPNMKAFVKILGGYSARIVKDVKAEDRAPIIAELEAALKG